MLALQNDLVIVLVHHLVMIIMEVTLLCLEEEEDIMLLELVTKPKKLFLFANIVVVKVIQRISVTKLLDILLTFSLKESVCTLIRLTLDKRLED